MKNLCTTSILVLAFLYLFGTFVQVAGVAFPVVGSGVASVLGCDGKSHSPAVPNIAPRRHMPMVKLVIVPSPALADREQAGDPQLTCICHLPFDTPPLVDQIPLPSGCRAPPSC
jgi:hypothetical protein